MSPVRLVIAGLLLTLVSGSAAAQPAKPAVIWDPSPNFGSRSGTPIDSVVIHTTEGSYSGAVSWLKNPTASASAHYVIKEDGSEISQLVDDADRAWHATYYNSRSIGIECAGFAGQASTWTQGILPKLYDLVAYLCYTYNVQVVHPPGQAVSSTNTYNLPGLVGHYQVTPWNRTDPGAFFDWDLLVTEVNLRLGISPNPNLIIDNTDPGFSIVSGSFSTGTTASGRYGADYRFANSVGATATAEAEWRPDIPQAGVYRVQVWYPDGANRATDSPFRVWHRDGNVSVTVDQTTGGGGWLVLGDYDFDTGTAGYLTLTDAATTPSRVVIADAVRFEYVAVPTSPGSGSSKTSKKSSGCALTTGSNWALILLLLPLYAARRRREAA